MPAVLVTGASTGIGAACARHLAAQGHLVFAGVRRDADAERLAGFPAGRIEPVHLDVTDFDSVQAARDRVMADRDGQRFAGVVNNAGVAFGGPVELQSLAEWRQHFDVNVVGAVAVTRAFLPLVREEQARVVFIGSVNGRVAVPFMAAYSASKFAVEGMAAALAGEVAPFGVQVAVVEPGPVRTEIWDKAIERADELERTVPAARFQVYEPRLSALKAQAREAGRRGASPDRVARVVEHALFASRPRLRYPVGSMARIGAAASRVLPDRALLALTSRTR
jgi:NAD(P)-dependent dehydrogenase (short-subunit alcohol dehydrogenase family)